jgi:hypothetical protein
MVFPYTAMLFELNYTDKQMLVYMESNPLTSNPKSKAIFTCLVNKSGLHLLSFGIWIPRGTPKESNIYRNALLILPNISHCLNPYPLPGWVEYLSSYGSSKVEEKFGVITPEFCWKAPELPSRSWVLTPLWTSSSTEVPILPVDESAWQSGGIEGTCTPLTLVFE